MRVILGVFVEVIIFLCFIAAGSAAAAVAVGLSLWVARSTNG